MHQGLLNVKYHACIHPFILYSFTEQTNVFVVSLKKRERKNACYMQRPLNSETTFTLKIRLFVLGSNNALSLVPIGQAAKG